MPIKQNIFVFSRLFQQKRPQKTILFWLTLSLESNRYGSLAIKDKNEKGGTFKFGKKYRKL